MQQNLSRLEHGQMSVGETLETRQCRAVAGPQCMYRGREAGRVFVFASGGLQVAGTHDISTSAAPGALGLGLFGVSGRIVSEVAFQ